MIIANGTIEFKVKRGGGIDPATGYPVASASVWGDAVPCQYLINSHDNLGRVQGEAFVRASYTVLIEQQPISSEQLRLTDRAGRVLGEFSIISVEQLDAVCQTQIMV
ncbi:MAG: hypothetical protein IJV22_06115 [Bacteroidales bacterium]|nr:hypothetical protein [Bacteroidales bacterium]